MKIPVRSAILSLAYLGASAAAFAQSVDLKPKWQVGKRYVQEIKTEQFTKMSMFGRTINQQTTSSFDFATAVKPHEDPSKKRLALSYQRMTMDMDMGGQKIHIDTADGGTDQLGIGQMFEGLTKQEIVGVLDASNKVVEVENLEAITKPIASANPMAGQMVAGMFSKDLVSQMFTQTSLKSLPAGPVKPGDSWTYESSMPLSTFGNFKVGGKYTFRGMHEHAGALCAEIAEEGTVDLEVSLNKEGAGGAGAAVGGFAMPKMKIQPGSGTVTGVVWFDPKLGFARESQLVQSMTLEMDNPINAGEKMSIPSTTTTTVTLKEVQDVK